MARSSWFKEKETDLAKSPRKTCLKPFVPLPALSIERPKLSIWTNGLAERMVRTAKENTIKVTRYENISEAIQDFKRFQNYHNYQRRLKMLQNRTPYEKMIEWYEKKPELFIYHPSCSYD